MSASKKRVAPKPPQDFGSTALEGNKDAETALKVENGNEKIDSKAADAFITLKIVLPDQTSDEIRISPLTPLIDLRTQLCAKYKLSTGSHRLEPLDLNGRMISFTSSSTLASTAAKAVHLKRKAKEPAIVTPPKVVEQTVRLTIKMSRSNQQVLRVRPSVALSQLLPDILKKSGVKQEDHKYLEIRHPEQADMMLDMSRSIDDYKIREIFVIDKRVQSEPEPDTISMPFSEKSHAKVARGGSEKKSKKIKKFFRFSKKTKSSAPSDDASSPDISSSLFQESKPDRISNGNNSKDMEKLPKKKKRAAPTKQPEPQTEPLHGQVTEKIDDIKDKEEKFHEEECDIGGGDVKPPTAPPRAKQRAPIPAARLHATGKKRAPLPPSSPDATESFYEFDKVGLQRPEKPPRQQSTERVRQRHSDSADDEQSAKPVVELEKEFSGSTAVSAPSPPLRKKDETIILTEDEEFEIHREKNGSSSLKKYSINEGHEDNEPPVAEAIDDDEVEQSMEENTATVQDMLRGEISDTNGEIQKMDDTTMHGDVSNDHLCSAVEMAGSHSLEDRNFEQSLKASDSAEGTLEARQMLLSAASPNLLQGEVLDTADEVVKSDNVIKDKDVSIDPSIPSVNTAESELDGGGRFERGLGTRHQTEGCFEDWQLFPSDEQEIQILPKPPALNGISELAQDEHMSEGHEVSRDDGRIDFGVQEQYPNSALNVSESSKYQESHHFDTPKALVVENSPLEVENEVIKLIEEDFPKPTEFAASSDRLKDCEKKLAPMQTAEVPKLQQVLNDTVTSPLDDEDNLFTTPKNFDVYAGQNKDDYQSIEAKALELISQFAMSNAVSEEVGDVQENEFSADAERLALPNIPNNGDAVPVKLSERMYPEKDPEKDEVETLQEIEKIKEQIHLMKRKKAEKEVEEQAAKRNLYTIIPEKNLATDPRQMQISGAKTFTFVPNQRLKKTYEDYESAPQAGISLSQSGEIKGLGITNSGEVKEVPSGKNERAAMIKVEKSSVDMNLEPTESVVAEHEVEDKFVLPPSHEKPESLSSAIASKPVLSQKPSTRLVAPSGHGSYITSAILRNPNTTASSKSDVTFPSNDTSTPVSRKSALPNYYKRFLGINNVMNGAEECPKTTYSEVEKAVHDDDHISENTTPLAQVVNEVLNSTSMEQLPKPPEESHPTESFDSTIEDEPLPPPPDEFLTALSDLPLPPLIDNDQSQTSSDSILCSKSAAVYSPVSSNFVGISAAKPFTPGAGAKVKFRRMSGALKDDTNSTCTESSFIDGELNYRWQEFKEGKQSERSTQPNQQVEC